MDMDQAAVWLAGSILFALGAVVIVAGLIAINNLMHKYWKPVRMFTPDSWQFYPPAKFVDPQDLKEPTHEGHQEKRNERSKN